MIFSNFVCFSESPNCTKNIVCTLDPNDNKFFFRSAESYRWNVQTITCYAGYHLHHIYNTMFFHNNNKKSTSFICSMIQSVDFCIYESKSIEFKFCSHQIKMVHFCLHHSSVVVRNSTNVKILIIKIVNEGPTAASGN